MHDECQHSPDEEGGDEITFQQRGYLWQEGAVADGGHRGAHQFQRDQDQGHTKQRAADLLCQRRLALQEHQPACHQQQGRKPAGFHAQELDHQRRAEIRPKHRWKTKLKGQRARAGKAGNQHRHRHRALHDGGKRHPGKGRPEPGVGAGYQPSEGRAKGALHARAHHPDGEQQQDGRAGQFQNKLNDYHFRQSFTNGSAVRIK